MNTCTELLSEILFSLHKYALQIMFYYDDLEICNLLGSKKSIHKLGICTINMHVLYQGRIQGGLEGLERAPLSD